jgi:hypothetical protein
MKLKIAVVGSGISGLSSTWLLNNRHDVTLFEAEDRLGGHSNTVNLDVDGRQIAVDTGFIVLNDRTYPNLLGMFRHLDVAIEPSDMGFAVSIEQGRLEYSGSTKGILAQPANLLSPRYWGMLKDLVRFFSSARALLAQPEDHQPTLGEWLKTERYGDGFIHDHLLPMGAAIWSCPVGTMTAFPARSFIRFFDNHGLLDFGTRPIWRTVTGGSQRYVAKLAEALDGRIRLSAPVVSVERDTDGVSVKTKSGTSERFDAVVLACHGDQAHAILSDKTAQEDRILGSFGYQDNEAILHGDAALMPKRKAVWSAWNYLAEGAQGPGRKVAVSYWMNKLQNLDESVPLFVSLNPLHQPREELVHRRFTYAHPVFDTAAIIAQRDLPNIQGSGGVWYCGSYCGWGFHEDGLRSGIAVARALGAETPWPSDVPAADSGATVLDTGPTLADAAD